MNELIAYLEYTAYQIRRWSLIMTSKAGSGHATSALSAADIMAVLFFHTMKFDPKNYDNPNNDRFILSKGHAAPILYAVWHELGLITEDELLTYREYGSALEGHPTFRFEYAEAATGSLGMGLSIGLGQALSSHADKRSYRTYVLMGDSEVSEGSVWEAAQVAAFYNTQNLVGIIDMNRLGQSTQTMESIKGNAAYTFKDMFSAFGWEAVIVDGHDIAALIETFDQIQRADKPVMIIAKTKKGYGIDAIEDKEGFHGKPISADNLDEALQNLEQRFPVAVSYHGNYQWKPNMPEETSSPSLPNKNIQSILPVFHDAMATRKAYGIALVQLGGQKERVISLDAEVKNSTYTELFEHEFPNRFYQCFIAEQNMVSMGVGFERRGKIPFISTFAEFLTRAHDQIRMAALSGSALRIVGSHAGVSIGQDGPSQMGLEDIAMMRTIPNSVVLYPSDAYSTYKLVQKMADHDQGISYLRTTRMATPLIYSEQDTFSIGGCKVLKQSKNDSVCVIAAGITVAYALEAYKHLVSDIAISVIDAYSIKPLDEETIRKVALASGGKVITVEDHYIQGGLGEAVAAALCNDDIQCTHLAVTKIPRSGKPEELLAEAQIDANAIIMYVRQLAQQV